MQKVMDTYKPKIGDWIIITGADMIGESAFNQSFPQGIFGRIISLNPTKTWRGTIEVRAYMRGGREHLHTSPKSIIPYKIS